MSETIGLFGQTSFDHVTFGKEVQDFIHGGLSLKDWAATIVAKASTEKLEKHQGNRFFEFEGRGDSFVVVSALPDFDNAGQQKRALDASYLINIINSRMIVSKSGRTSSIEDDRQFVAEAYNALIALEVNGRGLRTVAPKALKDTYTEVLYYSERQREITKKSGDDAGVLLIDGQAKPVLWTGTVTTHLLLDFQEALQRRTATKIIPESELRINFSDAVELYRGSGGGYKRLVDGTGKLTNDGQVYCAQQGIEPTSQALRQAALVPTQSQ